MATTEEKVIQVIFEELGINEDGIKLTSKFEDDLDCDSIDNIMLVLALEERFDIDISDEDAESIKTVQDAVVYIDKKIGKPQYE